jgi:hypothetical protein
MPTTTYILGCGPVTSFISHSGTLPSALCGYGTASWATEFGSGGPGSSTVVRATQIVTQDVSALVNVASPWADQYGHPTLARFKGSLANPSHPEYNWAGDHVKEQSPPNTGSDGCFVAGDPFNPPKITSVTGGDWWIQPDQHYEQDFIGYGGVRVAWLQTYHPERLPCRTTVQQQMAIFPDNVPANDPSSSQAVPYGSTNSGNVNTLQITVTQTGVSVSRAGVTVTREIHF